MARPFRGRLLIIVILAFAISVITGPANSFGFLFAQNILHLRGIVTAGMVLGSGVAGLAGLLAGRWLADRVGRRLTATFAMVALSLLATLTYRARRGAVRLHPGSSRFGLRPRGGGAVTSCSHVSPGLGGGLVEAAGVLGAVTGLMVSGRSPTPGRFGVAGVVTFLPAAVVMGLFWMVPETRGTEPEDLWPQS